MRNLGRGLSREGTYCCRPRVPWGPAPSPALVFRGRKKIPGMRRCPGCSALGVVVTASCAFPCPTHRTVAGGSDCSHTHFTDEETESGTVGQVIWPVVGFELRRGVLNFSVRGAGPQLLSAKLPAAPATQLLTSPRPCPSRPRSRAQCQAPRAPTLPRSLGRKINALSSKKTKEREQREGDTVRRAPGGGGSCRCGGGMRQFGGHVSARHLPAPQGWWGGSGPSGLLKIRIQALALGCCPLHSERSGYYHLVSCEVLCPWLQPPLSSCLPG